MSHLLPPPLSSTEILKRRSQILNTLLAMDDGFSSIPMKSIQHHTLQAILDQYDNIFLNGTLASSFKHIEVTLSARLTSSAGKFVFSRDPAAYTSNAEIRMSSDFLFRLENGPFLVNGLCASTPQEAFLIVFEHELCHALELVLYGHTGHGKRFLHLANRFFAHTETKHSLPTKNHSGFQNGLSVGSMVTFPFKGKTVVGLLSYLGKTASVMVRSQTGSYVDKSGKRYTKYRVPLHLLRRI